MKRVLTAVVLIPVVLLLTFKAPLWLFCAIVAVVAMLAMREYMDLVVAYGYEPLRIATYVLVPLYFALLAVKVKWVVTSGNYVYMVALFSGAATCVIFLYALLGMRKPLKIAFPSVALTGTGFVLIVFALATLVFIRVLPVGPFYLLYIFVVVWSGDAFAYWIGKSVGRHKLAPEVSPQKTWEGAVASLLFSASFGALLLLYSQPIVGWLQQHGAGMELDWAIAARLLREFGDTSQPPEVFSVTLVRAFICSALINIAAQFGDLVESMMKRGAGVKDSGSMLPGHGGMLDRVDALLFAAPFGFAVILFAIH